MEQTKVTALSPVGDTLKYSFIGFLLTVVLRAKLLGAPCWCECFLLHLSSLLETSVSGNKDFPSD